MKIVIIGGHLSPALAVIDGLPRDAEVLFIGRKFAFEGDRALSLEYREINKRKIPLVEISAGRLQRKFTKNTIPSFFKIPYGFVQSFLILRKVRPDAVLSFGGYLSLPVGISSFFLKIPLVIHEQTLEAGLANKILSIFAKRICISWETSFKYFPKNKTKLTGNPVRRFKIYDLRFKIAKEDKGLPLIYVTGGSGGSHYINTLVEGGLEELLEKFIIIHQTGDAKEFGDFERLDKFKKSLPEKLRVRYQLVKFVEPQEVGSILTKADLVIGRSGVNTITELIFFEKPSLLVPLPYSQNNEQEKNALFLKNKGLGEIFYQSEKLTSNKLMETLLKMFDNIDKYKILKPFGFVQGGRVQDDKGRAAKEIIDVVYDETKFKKK